MPFREDVLSFKDGYEIPLCSWGQELKMWLQLRQQKAAVESSALGWAHFTSKKHEEGHQPSAKSNQTLQTHLFPQASLNTFTQAWYTLEISFRSNMAHLNFSCAYNCPSKMNTAVAQLGWKLKRTQGLVQLKFYFCFSGNPFSSKQTHQRWPRERAQWEVDIAPHLACISAQFI